MPQIVLKFNDKVLKVVELDKPLVTIGRKRKNDLVINNLGVSSYHAQVVQEEGTFFIEDRGSTNGTFLNDRKIAKLRLKDGDQIAIGKHVVVFRDDTASAGASSELSSQMSDLDKSGHVATQEQPAFLKTGQAAARAGGSGYQPSVAKVGTFLIVSGQTDKTEYVLTGHASIIGSQGDATVKLTGWLSPKVAALVSRRDGGYLISMPDQKNKILLNGIPIQGRADLNDGDLVEVAGVKMYFYLTRPSS